MNLEEAISQISNPDRNIRVRAVRRISIQPSNETALALLVALRDEKRRVRETSAKNASMFLEYPEICAELQTIATNKGEKPKIRNRAMQALLGGSLDQEKTPSLDIAIESLNHLLVSEKYRLQILLGLLRLDLSEKVRVLLQDFVKNGTREEAVAATKALCGFRVINLGSIQDESRRKHLQSNGELAFGEVFYWVRRDDPEYE